MPTQVVVKNLNQRNAIRLRSQDAEVDVKTNRPIPGKWKPAATPDAIVKPNESADVYVGAGVRRVLLEELPT